MSMVMEVFAVRDVTLRRLLADPPLVWQLVAPDDPDIYQQARAEAAAAASGFFARLFGGASAGTSAANVAPLVLADDEGSVADLDKAWHGLHYLFTGTDEGGNPPLDFIAVGGEEIGTIDVGYGPARALAPPLVAQIAAKLASLSDAELRSRFNGPAMMAKKIYPEIWDQDPAEDDSLGYLMENLADLRKAVSDAAGRRQGLVLVLT